MDAVTDAVPKFDIEKALIPRDFPASWVAAVGEEFAKPYFAELRKFVTEERKQHQILPDAADFPATWPALRAAFGEVRPAATMLQAGLADPRMRIEIEVDAVIGSGG